MSTADYYKSRGYNRDDELGGRVIEKNGTFREETLCDQMLGRYFLRIKSGIITPPQDIDGEKTSIWSISIKILSEKEARQWVKQYLPPEAYVDIFGNDMPVN